MLKQVCHTQFHVPVLACFDILPNNWSNCRKTRDQAAPIHRPMSAPRLLAEDQNWRN